MPKMRTIEQSIKYIKEIDENTALTKHALRGLIINHQLPSVRVGCKYLINLETLEEYLQGNVEPQEMKEGSIRKQSERITQLRR